MIIVRAVLLFAFWWMLCSARAWELNSEQEATTGSAALRAVTKFVSDGDNFRLHLIWPEPLHTRLVVVDNPGNVQRLDQVMRERSCLAGINGGYFQPDMEPLGLLISDGRELNPLHRSRLLGGLLVMRERKLALLRVAEFSREPVPSQALQAGPFLVDDSSPVPGLEDTKRARRTVVLADGSGRYGLAVVEPPLTLARLANLLAAPEVLHELQVVRALNLDGGSSSSLWVRTSDGEVHLPERKRVRNFLCVLAAP
jgi:uncharacterized protein YigE (DUF2233 family)